MKHRRFLTELLTRIPARLCADVAGSRRGPALTRRIDLAAGLIRWRWRVAVAEIGWAIARRVM